MSLNQFSLADVCSIKHGYAFKGKYFSDSITKEILLTPGNFNIGGGFKKDKLKYYNGPIDKNYILKPYDLIVTMTDLSKDGDTLGFSALVPEDNNIYLHNQRIGLVENINEKIIDKNYLYWLLRNPEYHHYVVSSATGTTVKHTSPKTILKYEFELPSIQEQNFIGQLLTNIELKIELNKKINKNLTKLSSIIFINLMEKSNEFLELNECCKFIKGKKPKETSDYPQSNFLDYLTIDVLSNQSQMYAYDEKGILANEYDILMVMDGASSGKLFYGKAGLVGSTLAKLNVEEKYLEIVYQFLKQSEKFISDNTTGSAIPHTDKGLVLSLKCPISEELLNYSDTFKSIRSSIIINNNEILKLQRLRDTLLPKLMSGEIDVSKINCDLKNLFSRSTFFNMVLYINCIDYGRLSSISKIVVI